MFDLISIGDCVIDTFVPLTDAKVVDIKGEQMLCLKYGCKLPTGPSISLVAGNAANNAVGASRMGLKSAIYANVGDDEDGLKIRKQLEEEKVSTCYVVPANLASDRHIVLDFQGDRTILTYHQHWKYNLPDLDRTKWIYFTSLSPSFVDSNIVDQLINYLEKFSARLFYNPGTFQIKIGIKKNPRLLSLTEVFIVNLEEAKHILGFNEQDEIPVKKLLRLVSDLGPRVAVVTNNKEGSFGFDGEKYYHLGIFPAHCKEATGAGDAYATGVLAAFFYGTDLKEAMRWGAANGASVIEQIGAQEGLLTYNKMQDKLKENSKIEAKEI